MASYANFLGKQVTVQYRVGDVLLLATGTFVGDCGRSIFMEQHLQLAGKRSYFRWEIPYPYIHRIAESGPADLAASVTPNATPNNETPAKNERAAAAAASAAPSTSELHVPGLSPLPGPKPI